MLAICRTLALARAAFAVEEKPAGRFMIRHRIRVCEAAPGGRLVSGHEEAQHGDPGARETHSAP
jgi:hypothetical protein